MAAELLLTEGLPLGATRSESVLLQQQTAEALAAGFRVSCVFDLRPALDAAAGGACLNAQQLEGCAASLEAALKAREEALVEDGEGGAASGLCEQPEEEGKRDQDAASTSYGEPAVPAAGRAGRSIEADGAGQIGHQAQAGGVSRTGRMSGADTASSSGPARGTSGSSGRQDAVHKRRRRYPALAALAEHIPPSERALVEALRSCVSAGALRDEASPELAALRAARRANLAQLRSLVSGLARELAAKGASDAREPVMVRGRFAVAVRAGQRGALSKGSVKLGASQTGARRPDEFGHALRSGCGLRG
jgi:hypothetical protein